VVIVVVDGLGKMAVAAGRKKRSGMEPKGEELRKYISDSFRLLGLK